MVKAVRRVAKPVREAGEVAEVKAESVAVAPTVETLGEDHNCANYYPGSKKYKCANYIGSPKKPYGCGNYLKR